MIFESYYVWNGNKTGVEEKGKEERRKKDKNSMQMVCREMRCYEKAISNMARYNKNLVTRRGTNS
jgi:hypothetical protein